MHRRHAPMILLAAAATFGFAAAVSPAHALEVWSGRTHLFVRPDGADWTQPANQDRITPLVWLTRKSTQGLYNIQQEPGFVATSPGGTEWASGNAADHAGLTFRPWIQWAASSPPATVGVDAVVHLIADDIYVDIRFASWTASTGGGFSYYRAVAPLVPADRTTWGRIKSLHR